MSIIGNQIPDEIIAAYIDNGSLTPLERNVYTPSMDCEEILEIKEIIADARRKHFFSDTPVVLEKVDAIESYISWLDKSQELRFPESKEPKLI